MAPVFRASSAFNERNEKMLNAASDDKYRKGPTVTALVNSMTVELSSTNKAELLTFCGDLPRATNFRRRDPLTPAVELSTRLLIQSLDKRAVVEDVATAASSKEERGGPNKKPKTENATEAPGLKFALSFEELSSILKDTDTKLNELDNLRKGISDEIDRRLNLARDLFAAAIIDSLTQSLPKKG